MSLSEKSKLKKRKNRIWMTNKFDKEKSSLRKDGKIIPSKERCLICGKKTKYHHIFCPKCWGKRNEQEK